MVKRPVRRGRLDRQLPDDMVGSDHHWAYREAMYRFLARPEVTGVSVGAKIENHRCLDHLCVRVHVREKLLKSVLHQREILPEEIAGVPIDVIGRNYVGETCSDDEIIFRHRKSNPTQPGVSIGLAGHGSGTLGLVVFERESGRACLLSAAHVLAPPGMGAGQSVIQPDFRSGGTESNDTLATVGKLSIFDSRGDAAYAVLNGNRLVTPDLRGLNPPRIAGARMPVQGEPVRKTGAATCATEGVVESCCGQITVDYESLGMALTMPGFEVRPVQPGNPDGIEISEGGDSGAVWIGSDNMVVGLHVAGERASAPAADERAFACFITDVLDHLELSLEPADDLPANSLLTDMQPQLVAF